MLRSRAAAPLLPPAPPLEAISAPAPRPSKAHEASEKTREQKRFDRYDKDRDDIITRDELLAPRRKAYAKLDTDHDGRLSFEEWAIATSEKFARADRKSVVEGKSVSVPVDRGGRRSIKKTKQEMTGNS